MNRLCFLLVLTFLSFIIFINSIDKVKWKLYFSLIGFLIFAVLTIISFIQLKNKNN